VKKEVIQEAAEFFHLTVMDCCTLIELSKKQIEGVALGQTGDKLKRLSALVERHRSYEWAFPATHAASIKELRDNQTLWNFVFSDLKRFVSRTISVHYEGADEFTSDVVKFLSATGVNNQPLPQEGLLGLDPKECSMLTPDPEYIQLVATNQPWIFHLAFVLDCYLLHFSLGQLANELAKVNISG
jgi:hypothetical protein